MILDTNALSALADGENGLLPLLKSSRKHQIPVIVLGEYRYGLKRSRERLAREKWLSEEVEQAFDILPITQVTALSYSEIREELREAGTPIPENDIWIAALTRQYDLDLISHDKHFDYVKGLSRKSW